MNEQCISPKTNEEWKDIAGFNGYQVSNLGNVRNQNYCGGSNTREIAQSIDRKGYSRVSIGARGKRRTIRVHILVADAFIGPRPEGKQVNHINGIKTDNRVENLEYCTAKQNIHHAIENGLRPNLKGSRSNLSKLNTKQVKEILLLLRTHAIKDIADMYHVSYDTIRDIKTRRHWRHVHSSE